MDMSEDEKQRLLSILRKQGMNKADEAATPARIHSLERQEKTRTFLHFALQQITLALIDLEGKQTGLPTYLEGSIRDIRKAMTILSEEKA